MMAALGRCYVEIGIALPTGLDLPALLARHACSAYEPGMLVEHWGGRRASYWAVAEAIVIIETAAMSAEGWSGPLTFVEVTTPARYAAHVEELERGTFAPLNAAATREGAGYHLA